MTPLDYLATTAMLAVALAGGLLLRDAARHLIAARRADLLPEQMSTGAGLEPGVARETTDQVWSRAQADAASLAADRRRHWQSDARARTAEALWWVTPWGPFSETEPRRGLLHDAGCRYAATAAAEPLRFVLTLDEAIQRARDDQLEVCAVCDPLDGHSPGDHEAGGCACGIPAPAALPEPDAERREDRASEPVVAAGKVRPKDSYSILNGRTGT